MSFPKLEDWKAPWDDGEIDPEKAKAFAYSIKKAAYDADEKAKTDVKERDDALGVYKKAEDDAKRENESVTERLEREVKTLSEQLKTAQNPREVLILEVALEKGLTKKQASRLVGNTLEELGADADEYIAELGPVKTEVEDGEDGESEIVVRRNPTRKHTPGDPAPHAEPDTDVAAAIAKMARL